MLLTLEVVSPNGAALGANRKRVIGSEGVYIGRSKDNDWVIPNEYISRKNVCVRYVNGAFYVEGIGRNPLALNDPANIVANNEPYLLRDGDSFFLDQFEFRVKIGAGGEAEEVPEDPFADDPFADESSKPAGPRKSIFAPADFGIGAAESERTENLDPLDVLGGKPTRPPAGPKHVELNQGSILDNGYRPPEIMAPSKNKIPDTWDRSQISSIDPPPRQPDPFSHESPRAAKSGIPQGWDRTRHEATKAQSEVKPTVRQGPMAKPSPTPPPIPKPAPRKPTQAIQRDPEIVRAPPTAARQGQSPTRQPIEALSDGKLSIEDMLRSAGVTGKMSPEIAAELGEVFRVVVQGLMDVLHARAEIKSQLRMTLTRIESTENNPLKFSPNVDAALHTLFVERNRGYLPTVRAFESAIADIRNHQIAVLQGMRIAFDGMLEHFDPERIESELEENGKGSLLPGLKGRFRDFYVSRFEQLTRDKEDAFNELFGEKFAQAYEQQMARLKTIRSTDK